ncbi:hypothetical protein FB451DRAFT_196353 [Mycena latifolia]|nr:hypothetical protein FB451DRAFT_196353 [Mycena latifolia]
MSLEAVLGLTPVPGLSAAFTLLKFIASSVQDVKQSKKQLEVLAIAVAQLLATLDSEFRSSSLIVANCGGPLAELKILLEDIHRFVDKEQSKSFAKSLLTKDSRIASIEGFYRRIGMSVNAFQISGLLRIQSMLGKNEKAQDEDMNLLNTRLKVLEQNQVYLRETLEIKQDNMIAMMACIQRKLNGRHLSHPEQKFYSHTLQYLTSMSGQQVKLEDWMITSFDVEYGTEIGFGGFGKVYRGTWNRTDVAIKVLHTGAGITPSLVLLRKEIDFLGANTLDDKPFIVMPYIPNNAREFLKQQPTFDPVYILRDISLGLRYLHSRKICHGDIKGINILVEDSGRTLLCDFGLSRVKADVTTRTAQVGSTAMAGSRNWMAPELLAGSLPKLPSDIYAFGMTMYELYTDETPLASVAHTDFIELVFQLGVRPIRPDIDDVPRLTDPVWNLAELCWTHSAKERPTAGKIHDIIVDMISQMPQESGRNTSGKHDKVSEGFSTEPEEGLSDLERAARLNSDFLAKKQALGEDHPQTLSTMAELVHILPGLGRAKEAEELGVTATRKMKQVLGEDHPDTVRTMGNLARAYCDLGRDKEAEELQVMVIEKQIQVLREDHPDTLQTMQNLALTYSNLGRDKEAEKLGVKVMKRQKQVLGEDHPDTLLTIRNLALTYLYCGRGKEAEELGVKVMKQQMQVLGEDHPDTLLTMRNLALTYSNLGRDKEAEDLQVTVIKKQKQVLGEDHPDTLRTMRNLALTYSNLGRDKEAEDLQVTVIKKQKQVLGEDHPDTLPTIRNLANTYSDVGRDKEAEELQVMVMKKQKQVLGEDHPSTLQTIRNLANTYSNLGRDKEAEELQVMVMKKQKQVLGEDHPSTLRTMRALANTYSHLGRSKEAAELRVTVMKKQKQILGEDHPDTLLAMRYLANTYSDLGQDKAAEELQVMVMKKQIQALGENHPDTLLTMGNLANTYFKLDRYKESEELRVTVMKKQKQVLGEDHPDILQTMGNLALTYFKLDRYKEAEELGMTVMKKQKQVLGQDHPSTLRTMGNLANTYLKLGKSKKAEELAVTVTQKHKQVLGQAHPDTLWTMEVLLDIYKKQGKSAKAQSLSDTIKRIKIHQTDSSA